MDRLLDEARDGAFYLRQPAVADMIVEAIQYNASVLGHFALHAFVVMPNHVHLLATPAVALPKLTKSLKGITAKRANAMLALTGSPFWQEESYDHAGAAYSGNSRRSATTLRGILCERGW
jgi:REP element-mobilizing transposase RayT